MARDWLGEGIATAMGMLHVGGMDLDDAEQVKERLRSGFPAEEFQRAGGRGDLYAEVEQGRYQQLRAGGAIQTTTTIEVLGREAEIGIPVGWAACQPDELRNIPGNGDGATVRAFLYRPDADPSAVYSLQVLAVRTTLSTHSFGTEARSRAVAAAGRARDRPPGHRTCHVRPLGRGASVLRHLAGVMAGAAVGRPDQWMIETRSSELSVPPLERNGAAPPSRSARPRI